MESHCFIPYLNFYVTGRPGHHLNCGRFSRIGGRSLISTVVVIVSPQLEAVITINLMIVTVISASSV